MEMLEVIGKQCKTVAILLTSKMDSALKTLNESRERCGVPASNQHIFASQGQGAINCWQTMTAVAAEAGCAHPELITSSRLRKYVSTVVQVMF